MPILLIVGNAYNGIDYHIAHGNTTILHQEQPDFLSELFGIKIGVQQQQQQQAEEVLEVQLVTDAGSYKQISNGIKTIIISDSLVNLDIEQTTIFSGELFNKYDLIIMMNQLTPTLDQAIQTIQILKQYHLYIVINNIQQYQDSINKPVQSKNQFKYQTISVPSTQLALIHYSNYAMRVDQVQSLNEINQEGHYIRRNAMRLNCFWRELLSQLGKFPKYGA